VHELSGITLPDVAVTVVSPELKSRESRLTSRGGFLWTHFGCSGPAPMNVSRYVSSIKQPQHARLSLDLVPDLTTEAVSQLFDASQAGRKTVYNLLHQIIPARMAQCCMERAGLEEGKTLAELPRTARLRLVEDLKQLPISLSGTRGYAKAEVTMGGVNTKEVNSQTMESRLVGGLFLAGEILDIDGPIGGYNFQAAFSTGHLAALNM
jgi:predicted Rossmann fold flavoprotein